MKKHHLNIVKKVNKNILKIEKVYNERLTVSLNDEDSLAHNLLVLERLLNQIRDNLLNHKDIDQIAHDYSNYLKREIELLIIQFGDRVDNCINKVENLEMRLEGDNDIL